MLIVNPDFWILPVASIMFAMSEPDSSITTVVNLATSEESSTVKTSLPSITVEPVISTEAPVLSKSFTSSVTSEAAISSISSE